VSYQPEERYWTDYLRIALPVIGLLLILGLFWYWAAALINGDETDTQPTSTPLAVETAVNPPTATAAVTPTTVTIQPSPGPPVQPSPTPIPGAVQTPPPTAETAIPSDTDFVAGDTVVTTEAVRLRSGPTTTSDENIVQDLTLGTVLIVTGASQQGDDGNTWVPVVIADQPSVGGFVAADFLQKQ